MGNTFNLQDWEQINVFFIEEHSSLSRQSFIKVLQNIPSQSHKSKILSVTNDLAYCGHYDHAYKDFASNINKSIIHVFH